MHTIPPQLNNAVNVLNPESIPKFVTFLPIPSKMKNNGVKNDYTISVKKISQQMLPVLDENNVPTLYGSTPLFAYGSCGHYSFPASTIEAKYNHPVSIKWKNKLVDEHNNYIPHILPIDQTLNWANPPGGDAERDSDMNKSKEPYTGPVPVITHVHGLDSYQFSDGYPESWFLPNANNIDPSYAIVGSKYEYFNMEYLKQFHCERPWKPGSQTSIYRNCDSDGTYWYHDHTLGITRNNVYAGMAGFYILRNNPNTQILDSRTDMPAILPNNHKRIFCENYDREIPLVICDKTFNTDGTLFYPNSRSFFDGLTPDKWNITTIPDSFSDGQIASDVHPIHNPEFFGNTIVVNGVTWPSFEVRKQRYRFRILNGSGSRTFNIFFGQNKYSFAIIGTDGSVLAENPVIVNEQLILPGERYDIIVDFAQFFEEEIILYNVGPDTPFSGTDTIPANPTTTGLIMKFIINHCPIRDDTTPIEFLKLPPAIPLPPVQPVTRNLSINEFDSNVVQVLADSNGNYYLDENGVLNQYYTGDPIPEGYSPVFYGPVVALLGLYDTVNNTSIPLKWMDPITEDPVIGVPEVWRIYNTTMDAHPVHIHQVQFKVLGREPIDPNVPLIVGPYPLPSESNRKDTVISYPGEILVLGMVFDLEGLFVWHCHMLEHEDNELMRPLYVRESVNQIVERNVNREEFSVPNSFSNLTFIQNTDKKARLGLNTVSNKSCRTCL